MSRVLAIALALLVADQVLLHAGEGWLREGPLDELAHLLTGALVLAALRGVVNRGFAVGLLVMSVLIDVDHVPRLLGLDWMTRGTDRPYTHSLLTIAIVGLAAVLWRGRRSLLLGALLGIGIHLARDLSESASGVPLAWPLSLRSFTLPHWAYLLAMSVVLAVALWRARAPWRRVLAGVLLAAGLAGAATAAFAAGNSVADQPLPDLRNAQPGSLTMYGVGCSTSSRQRASSRDATFTPDLVIDISGEPGHLGPIGNT